MIQNSPSIEVLEAKLGFNDREFAGLRRIIANHVTAIETAKQILSGLEQVGGLWHWHDTKGAVQAAHKGLAAELDEFLIEDGDVWDLRQTECLTATGQLEADHPAISGFGAEPESAFQIKAFNINDRRVLLGAYAVEHESASSRHAVSSDFAFIASSNDQRQDISLRVVPSGALSVVDSLIPELVQ